MAGVEVTDGTRVTQTDAEGRYRLEFVPGARLVYVSVPAGMRARRFYAELPAVAYPKETAEVAADFAVTREPALEPGAPALAHVVDVRPATMPEAAAAADLRRALEHITRLRPRPGAVVVSADAAGARGLKAAVEALGEKLPPVYYVPAGRGLETETDQGAAPRWREDFGPTVYRFGAGSLSCLVTDFAAGSQTWAQRTSQAPPERTVVFSGSELLSMEARPLGQESPNVHDAPFPGCYRLVWSTTESRVVYPLDEPLTRWVYPVSGMTVGPEPLRLMGTVYDSTDARSAGVCALDGMNWKLASLAGAPGAYRLAEADVSGWKLVGGLRRELDRPGPTLPAGDSVVQVFGLGREPVKVLSVRVRKEPTARPELSTPWTGAGGNGQRTGLAPVPLVGPLEMAGWVRYRGVPGVVLEGKLLLVGRGSGRVLRWAEPMGPPDPEDAKEEPADLTLVPVGPVTLAPDWLVWAGEKDVCAVRVADAFPAGAVPTNLVRVPVAQGSEPLLPGTSVAVVGNVAAVVRADRRAVAVDLESGKKLWQSELKGTCLTPVGTEEGFIFGNETRSVRTGNLVIGREGPSFQQARVAVSGKYLVVTGLVDDGKSDRLTQSVACFQVHTGKRLWGVDLARVPSRRVGMRTPGAVVTGDKALVGSADGMFYCLDLAGGTTDWKLQTGSSLLPLEPNEPGPESTLSAPRTSAAGARITASAVVAAGRNGPVVYFGGLDGVLHAVDVNWGKELFSYDLGWPIADDLVISGNCLMCRTLDGMVFWLVPKSEAAEPGN